jgi:HEAT repeat protein
MDFEKCLQIGKPAVEPLINAISLLGELERTVRAAEVLGEIGDPRALGRLIECLSEEKLGAQKEVQEAIVKFGKRAVPELIDAMKNYRGLVERRDRTWRRIIDILAKVGDEQAIEPMINILRESSVQLEAARALGEIGNEMAVEPLINALDNESGDVRYEAAESLKKIYHNQKLSDQSKKMILSQKGRLIREKYSWENRKGCSHSDYPAVYFNI